MFDQFIHTFGADVASYLGAALAGVAGYWCSKALRSYKDWRKYKNNVSIPKLLSKDIGVYKYLTELLVQTNADRAYVLLFHNGVFYINKGSHMKVSCTHEIVRTGVSREQDSIQEKLASKFAEQITQIIQENVSVTKIDPDNNSYFHQMKRSQGVDTVISAVMRDGEIIEGVISVNYLAGNEVPDTTLEDRKHLVKEAAETVGFLLRKVDE